MNLDNAMVCPYCEKIISKKKQSLHYRKRCLISKKEERTL